MLLSSLHNKKTNINPEINGNRYSFIAVLVCIYIFLVIERPWESIRYLHEIPIERTFAVFLILSSILSGKFAVERSLTNFWVYGLLLLHFLLTPFSYSFEYSLETGIEYAKMVVLYLLMLSVARDEDSLRLLVKAFVFTMFIYMSHSLLEYFNGRHVYRMGISRMVGVDETFSDPNTFGASVVLCLPFVYALLRSETKPILRKIYLCHFALAVVCVILTGSRSASIALVFLALAWALTQKGMKKFRILILVLIALGAVWTVMPAEKRERIQTLWDEDVGPKGAHQSAEGRLYGWKVSWEMFKQQPFTGVGPGGKNYMGYRIAHDVDSLFGNLPSPTQSHHLYGEVLAEFGIVGAFLFVGLVVSIWHQARRAQKLSVVYREKEYPFLCYLGAAILIALLLLLLLGFGGHNFYRPLWLWLAAWSGSLVHLSEARNMLPVPSTTGQRGVEKGKAT